MGFPSWLIFWNWQTVARCRPDHSLVKENPLTVLVLVGIRMARLEPYQNQPRQGTNAYTIQSVELAGRRPTSTFRIQQVGRFVNREKLQF